MIISNIMDILIEVRATCRSCVAMSSPGHAGEWGDSINTLKSGKRSQIIDSFGMDGLQVLRRDELPGRLPVAAPGARLQVAWS